MSKSPHRLPAVILAVAMAGCGGDSGSGVVAKLTEGGGAIDRQAASGEPWSRAAVGATFVLGSAVRTGTDGSGVVSLTQGGRLRLDADTLVRFARNADQASAPQLSVEAGAVEIEAESAALRFATELGAARIEPRSRVRVGHGSGGLRLAVTVGRVVLDEDERAIEAGASVSIQVGGVLIEEEPPPAKKPERSPEQPVAMTGGDVEAKVKGSGAQVLGEGGWKKLAEGDHELASGTRVKTRRGTSMTLTRGKQKAVLSGAADAVIGSPDGALVDAKSGVVEVIASGENVRIAVPGGTLVVRDQPGGSQARVAITSKGTDVRVGRGRVAVGDEVLKPGERGKVSRAGAVAVANRAPPSVAFSFEAGTSPVVHAPSVPLAVGIRFAGRCRSEAVLELAGRKGFDRPKAVSAGQARAHLRVRAGTHRYRVLCHDEGAASLVVASGTFRVRRDNGRRRLARKPPHNVLDADGRRYKVLYQNQLPRLTMRWRNAPAASGYQLHIDGRGPSKQLDTKKAQYSLASGAVGEGVYTFWFTASGSKARSPKTHLVVDFDNAAATAYLASVRRGEAGAIRIEGAVLGGWRVSASGTAISLDRHKRFVSEVLPLAGETAVAVKLVHAKRGVHYYVVKDPGR